MIIIESSLRDFQIINKLDGSGKRLMANLVNVSAATPYIVNAFNRRSQSRPNLKKFGIYVKLIFKNIQILSPEKCYQNLVAKYLLDIGWNDLQYIGFITYGWDDAQIEIILNRVVSGTKIIDLKCLKPTNRQYKMLRESIYRYL